MPPLVVPITVTCGLNSESRSKSSAKAAIIMCDARCKRPFFRPFCRGASRRLSGISAAVLQRQSLTSNRVTGVTQSAAFRREMRVSPRPKPRGLTIPAATTATRVLPLVLFKSLKVGISPAILVAFQIEAFYTMSPKGENSSSEVRRLSHGMPISGNLMLNSKHQYPGGVFQIRLNGN